MYHDKIRDIDVELKPTYIETTFDYNGEVYVKLSQTGLDYFKNVCKDTNEGDFRYIIIKKD